MTKILLAEADVDRSVAIFTCLEEHGYVVELATDGKIAMNALDRTEYDATIVSKVLPDLDGMEICKKYKAKGGKGPIIMLAELAGSKNTSAISGVDLLLDETTDADSILSTVKELLEKPTSYSSAPSSTAQRLSFINESTGASAVVVNRGRPVYIDGIRSSKGDATSQVQEALQSLSHLLEKAGGTIFDIAQITAHIVDLNKNVVSVSTALNDYLGEHRPLVTLLGVSALVDKSLIELSAVAYID